MADRKKIKKWDSEIAQWVEHYGIAQWVEHYGIVG